MSVNLQATVGFPGQKTQNRSKIIKNNNKKQTRMTASVLKQDPNSQKVKKNKLGQKHNLQIFWVIPFMKLQNDIQVDIS